MWRSWLFWKLFIAYGGLSVASIGLIAGIVVARQREQVLDHVRERLRDDAILLRGQLTDDLASDHREGMAELIQRVARETGTRMTVIAGDGTVLADSERDPGLMENHHSRQEVAQALREETGIASHTSRTLGIPMMYLALRVGAPDDPTGFVRVALPISAIERRVSATQRLIWVIAGLVGIVTLVLAYWFARRITRPVASLTEAARGLANGEYGTRVRVQARDELGTLGDAFNRMSVELSQRVARMRTDQELLETVLGGMVEGVIAVDSQERVLFANAAARMLLNLPSASLANRHLWELVRFTAVQQAVQEAFQNDQAYRSEFEVPGGNRRTLALTASRLPGMPSPGAVLVVHDVSELRRLEGLRRDFVANVSHELKTPLSSIKAYAETLLAGALDDPEHNVAFVRQIEEQSDRLHQLIVDLLSLARIESGKEAFDIVPINLARLIEASLSQHQPAALSRDIHLTSGGADRQQWVMADEEGLRAILNNLIDNAIKYTPQGGRVTVRWSDEGATGLIEVEDTGIGISSQDQARIFERFYRADKARSREVGGTGLGLSIVKHLTQALSGTVSLTSELGRGSRFQVRLPAAAKP